MNAILDEARAISYNIAIQQEKYVGKTIVDIYRDMMPTLDGRSEKDFPLLVHWKKTPTLEVYDNDPSNQRHIGNRRHRFHFFDINNRRKGPGGPDYRKPISDKLWHLHRVMKRTYKPYNSTTYKNMKDVENALDEFFFLKSYAGAYTFDMIKKSLPSSRQYQTTKANIPRQVQDPFRADRLKTGGMENIHFCLLRFFEVPIANPIFQKEFKKHVDVLIELGKFDEENIIRLVMFACAITLKMTASVNKYFQDIVFVNNEDGFMKGKRLPFQQPLSWHVIIDLLESFVRYSTMSDEEVAGLWGNMNKSCYEFIASSDVPIAFTQHPDKLAELGIKIATALGHGKQILETTWDSTGKWDPFFHFLSAYSVYHTRFVSHRVLAGNTPYAELLHGKVPKGQSLEAREPSFFPKDIRVKYKWKLKENDKDGEYLVGPATFLEEQETRLSILDFVERKKLTPAERKKKVVTRCKQLPFSVVGFMDFLSEGEVNKDPDKSFDVFDVYNSFLVGDIVEQQNDGTKMIFKSPTVKPVVHEVKTKQYKSSTPQPSRVGRKVTPRPSPHPLAECGSSDSDKSTSESDNPSSSQRSRTPKQNGSVKTDDENFFCSFLKSLGFSVNTYQQTMVNLTTEYFKTVLSRDADLKNIMQQEFDNIKSTATNNACLFDDDASETEESQVEEKETFESENEQEEELNIDDVVGVEDGGKRKAFANLSGTGSKKSKTSQ